MTAAEFDLTSLYLRTLEASRGPASAASPDNGQLTDWSAYFSYLADFERYLSPQELRLAGQRIVRDASLSTLILAGDRFFSLRDQYLNLFGEAGIVAAAFPVGLSMQNQGDQLQLNATFGPQIPACQTFFELLTGQLEALPTCIGLPAATVDADISDQTASFRIRLPRPSRLGALLQAARFRFAPRRFAIQFHQLVYRHLALLRLHQARSRDDSPAVTEADSGDNGSTAAEGLFSIDGNGSIVHANAAFAELLGYTTDEILGIKAERLFKDPPILADSVLVTHGLHRRRIVVPVELRHAPGSDAGKHSYFVRDLTDIARFRKERQDLESRLQTAQKTDVIGQLSSGIVHDFNNLLLAIRAQAEMALDNPTAHTGALREIIDATVRGTAVTGRLLAFGRREQSTLQRLDLKETVTKAVSMVAHLLPENISLQVEADASVFVDADPNQFEQVLVNLIINARDAMPAGGQCSISLSKQEQRAMLVVSDNGSGMTEDIRQRIFDPLFTTKAAGQGTGLGLSVVADIVHAAGGEIVVNSRVGEGTSIEMTLPLSSRRPRAAKKRQPSTNAGDKTVLVVEDNDRIRELTRMMLKSGGFHVLTAATGQEAVDITTKHIVDVVLLDVVLRGISGREAATRIHELSPGTQILFTSAYPAGSSQIGFIEDGKLPFLAKPFGTRELRDAVHAALVGENTQSGTG